MKSDKPYLEVTEVVIDECSIPKDGQFIKFVTKGNNKSRFGYFSRDSLQFITLAGGGVSYAEVVSWKAFPIKKNKG